MFKPIPGYPNYEINEEGVVRNIKKQRVIKPVKQRYLRVTLHRNGIPSAGLLVHQLVMSAHVGPKPSGMCVRHLDGDPYNNSLENLAYGSLAENQQDRLTHGTYGMKLSERKIRIIRGLYLCGFTQARISDIMTVSRQCISRVCTHKSWANVS
jgi:hypothetical protein